MSKSKKNAKSKSKTVKVDDLTPKQNPKGGTTVSNLEKSRHDSALNSVSNLK